MSDLWWRIFLLDRFGYLSHRFVGSGPNLANDLHREAHHFRHALGSKHDQGDGKDYNDLE